MAKNSPFFLGVNLGFAVNRYPEPEDWVSSVLKIGVKRVQFVADLLNPSLPVALRRREINRIYSLCQKNEISIESAFTGAFTRVNHFGSSNPEIREYWINWFVEYARQMSIFGVTSIGGHPGIISIANDCDFQVRKNRIHEIAICWEKVLERTSKFGIKNILWEPMSISREIGHTIEDASNFQEILEKRGGNAFKICLDLDHGDIESTNLNDCNPIAWITEFRNKIGALHLKQTSINRRKHMSFTPSNNQIGTVKGAEIMSALRISHVDTLTMFLELGFRERNPDDRNSEEENRVSVEYWKSCGAQIN
jgi:sugar phosphate isomerase/epimerase